MHQFFGAFGIATVGQPACFAVGYANTANNNRMTHVGLLQSRTTRMKLVSRPDNDGHLVQYHIVCPLMSKCLPRPLQCRVTSQKYHCLRTGWRTQLGMRIVKNIWIFRFDAISHRSLRCTNIVNERISAFREKNLVNIR